MLKIFVLMFVAMSMIPAGDAAGKILTTDHSASPLFVAWSRFALGALVALPLARHDTVRLLGNWRIWLRACMLLGGITCIQIALQTAPIANVFAAFFIGPIFSYVLSVLLLKESVTPVRNIMMALGFLGVLLVVRPGLDTSSGLMFAAMAGLFYGTFLTTSRWLSTIARPASLLFTQLFIPALLLTPFAWTLVPDVTLAVTGLTLASSLFSMGGNFLLLFAYARADATTLAPFVYFQLFAATLLGWILFQDLPDGMTWLGLALIIGAGIASATLGTGARRSKT